MILKLVTYALDRSLRLWDSPTFDHSEFLNSQRNYNEHPYLSLRIYGDSDAEAFELGAVDIPCEPFLQI